MWGSALEMQRMGYCLALAARGDLAQGLAGVDLARAVDLGVELKLLTVLSNPARQAADGEEDGEEVRREAHGAVNEAGVEVHVRVELAGCLLYTSDAADDIALV